MEEDTVDQLANEDGDSPANKPLLPKSGKKLILDQERFLPIANIARIMKKMIPSSGKVAKDAKECVQECVSEFISFLTTEAVDRCKFEKRKTITGEDIMRALHSLGFDEYSDVMDAFMTKYRTVMKYQNPRFSYSSTSQTLQEGTTKPPPIVSPQVVTVAQSQLTPQVVTVAQSQGTPQVVAVAQPQMGQHVITAPAAGSTVYLSSSGGQQFQLISMEPTEQRTLDGTQIYVDVHTNQPYVVVENNNGVKECRPLMSANGVVSVAQPSTSTSATVVHAVAQPQITPQIVRSTPKSAQPRSATSTQSVTPTSSPTKSPPKPTRKETSKEASPPGPMRVTRSAARNAQVQKNSPYGKGNRR